MTIWKVEDVMVAAFAHEAEHDLDTNQIKAVQSGIAATDENDVIFHPSVYNPITHSQEPIENSPKWQAGQVYREVREQRAFNYLYNGRCLTPEF